MCRAQLGRFESRRAELTAKGASLAAVAVDPVEASQAMATKLGLGFPILSDPGGAVTQAWGVQHEGRPHALPAVFVVGTDGRIAWRKVSGTITDRPTEDEVLSVVGGLAPAK